MDPLHEASDSKDALPVPKRGKKRRKMSLTLGQKAEILDRLKRGEGSTSVAKALKINESTVRSIKKMEARIRASLAAGVSKCAKVTLFNITLRKMERALMSWMNEEEARGVTLDMPTIQAKAKVLHDQVLESSRPSNSTKDTPFLASKGWFMNFKKRYEQNKRNGFQNDAKEATLMELEPGSTYQPSTNFEGENVESKYESTYYESSIVDYEAADRFTKDIATLIKDRGYKAEQIFNADETKMFWKRMPKKTCLAKRDTVNPGYKAGNDRMTILLCGNASGDLMVKPMVIYRTLNPGALKDKNKFHLPVFWKTNKRAGITAKLFNDWFHNCFVHEVQRFLVSKSLDFKVLLILDDALCHPEELQFAHPNIEVVFLPANTGPYLQPMEQGINVTFKSYYSRYIFQHLLDGTETNVNLLNRIWDSYSIADCIKNIKESLDDIKPSLINVCWKNLWRKAVISNTCSPSIKNESKKLAKLGRLIKADGFDDLQAIDVEEFLDSHNIDISDEEYRELIHSSGIDTKSDQANACLKSQQMLDTLEKGFLLARQLGDLFFTEDPFMERSLNFNKELEASLAPYKEMYKILQNKTKNMTTFYFPECDGPENDFDNEPAPHPSHSMYNVSIETDFQDGLNPSRSEGVITNPYLIKKEIPETQIEEISSQLPTKVEACSGWDEQL